MSKNHSVFILGTESGPNYRLETLYITISFHCCGFQKSKHTGCQLQCNSTPISCLLSWWLAVSHATEREQFLKGTRGQYFPLFPALISFPILLTLLQVSRKPKSKSMFSRTSHVHDLQRLLWNRSKLSWSFTYKWCHYFRRNKINLLEGLLSLNSFSRIWS